MFGLFKKEGEKALGEVEAVTEKTVGVVNEYVAPVRKTLIQRFPVTFLLLVTVGVTATFLGVEQIILKYALFHNKPELILLFGVVILAFTGTINKKLG